MNGETINGLRGIAISELKEKAVFVTKTNNDAGIADALEHYLCGEVAKNPFHAYINIMEMLI